ncbi:MAG: bifunctional helix-turn-helix transcriptional regulator/GNAT family N-acetyltransferase [Gammaproteobacteria bacterium]
MNNQENIVAKLRFSSREMVRELGIISEETLFGLPASFCHTLIELDLQGALNHMELAAILKVDKSTVSRIIKKLLQQKLVVVSPNSNDQRYKRILLTQEGKKVVKNINQLSNKQVNGAFSQLTIAEQHSVLHGIELYAKALKRSRLHSEFQIRLITKKDNLDLMLLIRKTLKEYGADRPGFAFVDSELEDMHKAYSKDKCTYFVVERKADKKIVGGAGIGPLEGETKKICELKKMYFVAEIRGLGLGYTLVQHLLTFAKQSGYKQCYLETLKSMNIANHLYKKLGFTSLNKPLGNTGHFSCDTWYVKDLSFNE